MLFIEKSYIIIVMIGEYKDLRRIEMGFIEQLKIKAKSNKKTIVLPEGMDRRTYEAAQQIVEEDFSKHYYFGQSRRGGEIWERL